MIQLRWVWAALAALYAALFYWYTSFGVLLLALLLALLLGLIGCALSWRVSAGG